MTGFEKEGQTCTRDGCLSVRNLKGRPAREVEAGGLLSWATEYDFLSFVVLGWGDGSVCITVDIPA